MKRVAAALSLSGLAWFGYQHLTQPQGTLIPAIQVVIIQAEDDVEPGECYKIQREAYGLACYREVMP